MKKLLILTLTTALLISQTAFAGNQFTDLSANYKYESDIDFIASNNIVQGYPDGTYKPNRKLNRAELLKIMVLGLTDVSDSKLNSYSNKSCFSDVKSNQWYTKYVCYAKAEGIIKGNPDGTFRPADKINLVEALKITLNSLGAFFDEGTPWYKDLTEIAADAHIIPLAFDAPDQTVTRGQMANLLHRTMKSKLVENPYSTAVFDPFTSDYVTYDFLTDNYIDCYGDNTTTVKNSILGPTFAFCRLDEWGYGDEGSANQDDLYEWIFFKKENGDANQYAPKVSIYKDDQAASWIGVGGVPNKETLNYWTIVFDNVTFSKINFNKTEAQMKKDFAQNVDISESHFTLEKTKVAGKDAIRVEFDVDKIVTDGGAYEAGAKGNTGVKYYIPNAVNSKHIVISTDKGGIDAITELDEFANKIRF